MYYLYLNLNLNTLTIKLMAIKFPKHTFAILFNDIALILGQKMANRNKVCVFPVMA